MHQIDYRLNAIHGLKMLLAHDSKVQEHEKNVINYMIGILDKSIVLVGVSESYGSYNSHSMSLDGHRYFTKKVCTHDWEYVGHTHNMKHFKCRHCGAEKEE